MKSVWSWRFWNQKTPFCEPTPRSLMKNPPRRGTARHTPRAAEEFAARFPYSDIKHRLEHRFKLNCTAMPLQFFTYPINDTWNAYYHYYFCLFSIVATRFMVEISIFLSQRILKNQIPTDFFYSKTDFLPAITLVLDWFFVSNRFGLISQIFSNCVHSFETESQ